MQAQQRNTRLLALRGVDSTEQGPAKQTVAAIVSLYEELVATGADFYVGVGTRFFARLWGLIGAAENNIMTHAGDDFLANIELYMSTFSTVGLCSYIETIALDDGHHYQLAGVASLAYFFSCFKFCTDEELMRANPALWFNVPAIFDASMRGLGINDGGAGIRLDENGFLARPENWPVDNISPCTKTISKIVGMGFCPDGAFDKLHQVAALLLRAATRGWPDLPGDCREHAEQLRTWTRTVLTDMVCIMHHTMHAFQHPLDADAFSGFALAEMTKLCAVGGAVTFSVMSLLTDLAEEGGKFFSPRDCSALVPYIVEAARAFSKTRHTNSFFALSMIQLYDASAALLSNETVAKEARCSVADALLAFEASALPHLTGYSDFPEFRAKITPLIRAAKA